MKVAFLTAGGNAPCLSASIGRLIRNYSNKESNIKMVGYLHGYKGLLTGRSISINQNVIKNAEILGIDINKTASFKIETQKEISLSKMLLEFPDVIIQISKELEPHHITKYTLDLASEFHSFYQSEKIIDQDNLDNTISKLILCKAIQKTLKKSLEIMMISAPENM